MTEEYGAARETRSGTARTRDGVDLRYIVHGVDDPARPRLVLVHSLAMDGTVWDGVVSRLVGRAAVLTYDCRGHGASTKAAGPYRLEQFADDLADLLDCVGWERIHLAGASMGGSVALQFVTTYTPRVLTLGLLDTTAWYGPEAADRWAWRAREAEEKELAGLIAFQQARWFTDAFRDRHPDLVERSAAVFLKNDRASFAATCQMLGGFDLRSALAGIAVPTAIVVGEEDYATPLEMAQALEQGIPGATLRVVPEARHLTFIERPDVIAEVLAGLIRRGADSVTPA